MLSTATGAALLLVAGVTMLALVPAVFFTLGVLAGVPAEDLPGSHAEIFLGTGALVAIAIVTRRAGLWLLRGSRELVLFLRRFGYRDATSVASFAATKTIGRSWRLVTLDDAAITPVGVAGGVSGLLRTGERMKVTGSTLYLIVARIVVLVCLSAAGILLYAYLQSGSLSPYEDILTDVGSGRLPAELGDATLAGAVAAAAVGVALVVLVLGAVVVVRLMAMVLLPVRAAGSVVAEAARTAESQKQREVSTAADIDVVAHDLDVASKRVFAPRLVVLRVASEIWQPTVRRLAFVSTLTIIDVSEPSENLLWEVQELIDRLGPRCVFVGHHDRVAALADRGPDAAPLPPYAERLLVLLEGREVLAYRTDPAAVQRFARALQAKLLEVAALYPATSSPELEVSGGAQPYSEAGVARLEEELAGLDAVVARGGETLDPAQRERVCRALASKAATLGALGRHDEQLAVYDEIVARYGDAPDPALREQTAGARAEKIVVLKALGRREDELVACDEMIAAYQDLPEPALRPHVARALAEKAAALADAGRHAEAVGVCDDAVARFGDDAAPGVRERVAQVLAAKAGALAEMGHHADALAACDAVLARCEGEGEARLEPHVATAKLTKGIVLARLGRSADASAVYDDVIARYSGRGEEPLLLRAVSTAARERYLTGESRSRLAYVRAIMGATQRRTGSARASRVARRL